MGHEPRQEDDEPVPRRRDVAVRAAAHVMYAVGLGFAVAGGMASYAELARCAGAVERVLEIADRSPAMRGGNARAPSAAGATVSFRDVDFAYPARRDATVLAAWSAEPSAFIACCVA